MDSFFKRFLIATFLFVICLWRSTLFLLGGLSYEARGSFGNMSGGVAALFLGLAFTGVIFAILFLDKQLGLQMQQLH